MEGLRMNLYVTADRVGLNTGGGSVTYRELHALSQDMGEVSEVLDRTPLESAAAGRDVPDPWVWDDVALEILKKRGHTSFNIAHFYAGTFSKTVAFLRGAGCKVSYTAAAHSIEESRKAHEELGVPYNFPHLTDPGLWRNYLQGYLDADLLIVPSAHSAAVMTGYGRKVPIAVIPHGCDLPREVVPFPARFTVGYLGAYGPDKGVVDLLRAWRHLNYRDATLFLGGRDSRSDWVRHLCGAFGGGDVECVGWVDSVSDFYNACSLYVQPSRSEGFGCEVTEACAHQRPVVASQGAGASYLLPSAWTYPAGDWQTLARKIDTARRIVTQHPFEWFSCFRRVAEENTWEVVRGKYVTAWKCLLGERA